jgi:hypothetical protein
MQNVFDTFPEVLIDHDNENFYMGLINQTLILNRCKACGTWHAEPLRSICHNCQSWDIEPTQVSGQGKVYMITLLHQGPVINGVSYSPPLPLAVIELDEQKGLRVSASLLGEDTGFNAIGKRVRLVWPHGQVAPRLAFELMETP